MDAIEDYYLPLGASFSPLDKEVPGVPEGFSKQDNHFPPPCFVDQSSADTNKPNGSDATRSLSSRLSRGVLSSDRLSPEYGVKAL